MKVRTHAFLLLVGLLAGANAQQSQATPPRGTSVANVLDFSGANPTGEADSVSAINAALATGRDVYLPGGTYVVGTDWIRMTIPNQRLFCDGPSTRIVVARHGGSGTHSASPALVIYQSAVGARFEGCSVDQNGAQFGGDFPNVPLQALNSRSGAGAFNAALGTAVLVMADFAQINGVQVTRGWNVCVGFGVFDFNTGQPSPGPVGASYTNSTTSYCGRGLVSGRPNYREGAGVDNFSGLGIRVTNNLDFGSQVGLYLDTGASSTIVDTFASYNAEISPHIAGTWQNTIGGDSLWIGSQNRLFNGETWGAPKGPTIVNNFYAFQPMRHCVFGFWSVTGATLNNIKCVRPGLEGIRMEGGMNIMSNVWVDQANWLKGNTSIDPGIPAEQTNAVQINANSASYLSSLYWNTDIVIDGLNVTAGEEAKYAYAIGMESSGSNRPKLRVTPGNVIASGQFGMYTGDALSNLNVTGEARAWAPSIAGSAVAGSPTYEHRSGEYWQVGGSTYLTFNVSTTSLGGAAGSLQIGNLPIPSSGKAIDVGQCWLTAINGYKLTNSHRFVGGQIDPNSTAIKFLESGADAGIQQIPIANVNGAQLRLMGACIYTSR